MASGILDSITSCPLCGGAPDPARLPYLTRGQVGLPAGADPFVELEIRFCSACGFGWASPPVTRAVLNRYYASEYWNDPTQGDNRPVLQEFAPLEPRSVAQLNLARTYGSLEGAMLDIGPGPRGGSFRALAELAPQMRGFAFEPDIASADFLSRFLNVHVLGGTFPADVDMRQLGVPGGFQVILMSHVLEHFNGCDVVATLEAAGRLLANPGVLMCEVPHVDMRRHADIRGHDSPHLSFFSVAGIRRAVERAGLEPLFANTCGPNYEEELRFRQPDLTPARVNPPPQREGTLRNWARRFPVNIPKPVGAWLYSVMAPQAGVRMLRSDAFDYGDDRTWLRVVARRP